MRVAGRARACSAAGGSGAAAAATCSPGPPGTGVAATSTAAGAAAAAAPGASPGTPAGSGPAAAPSGARPSASSSSMRSRRPCRSAQRGAHAWLTPRWTPHRPRCSPGPLLDLPEAARAHLQLSLARLAVPAHFARGDAAHNLGERQAAALAALAHAAEQRAQQLALVRQPLLVALGLEPPAEAALRAQPSGLGARDETSGRRQRRSAQGSAGPTCRCGFRGRSLRSAFSGPSLSPAPSSSPSSSRSCASAARGVPSSDAGALSLRCAWACAPDAARCRAHLTPRSWPLNPRGCAAPASLSLPLEWPPAAASAGSPCGPLAAAPSPTPLDRPPSSADRGTCAASAVSSHPRPERRRTGEGALGQRPAQAQAPAS